MRKKDEKRLDKMVLLKIDDTYKISGGGRVLLWTVALAGGWRKYLKREKNEADIEMAKTFLEQEKKYGIKVILPSVKDGLDNDYEHKFRLRRQRKDGRRYNVTTGNY